MGKHILSDMYRRIKKVIILCSLSIFCINTTAFAAEEKFDATEVFLWESTTDDKFVENNMSKLGCTYELIMCEGAPYDNPEREQQFQYRIDTIHSLGLKALLYISASNIGDKEYEGIALDSSLARIGIDGKPVHNPYGGKIEYCKNNPKVLNVMITKAQKNVLDGVDSIGFDEFMYDISTDDGCFCKNCMEGFRHFLKNKYSTKILLKMGIKDIDNFDYRSFINRKYLKCYMAKGDYIYKVPFYNDYKEYKIKSGLEAFKKIRDVIKETGKTLGKEIMISGNTFDLYPETLCFTDLFDYFAPETTFNYPVNRNNAAKYKLTASMKKPLFTIMNSGTGSMKHDDISEIMQVYTAEAYANRGYMLAPFNIWAWDSSKGGTKGKYYSADLKKMSSVYNFIKSNHLCYDGLESTAEVAVLYSYPSSINPFSSFYENFYGITDFLEDRNYQYNIVFAGNNDWVSDYFDINTLKKYKTIILPSTSDLSDKQVNMIRDYVSGGGKVLAFGDIATNNEKGVKRKSKTSITYNKPCEIKLGKGIFKYSSKSDIGINYRIQRNLKGNDIKSLRNSLDSFSVFPVGIEEAKNLGVNLYWNENLNSYIAHFVNYDYNTEKKSTIPAKNVKISFNALNKLDNNAVAYYIDPITEGIKELKSKYNNGVLTVSIPNVSFYGILSIGEKGRFKTKWKMEKVEREFQHISPLKDSAEERLLAKAKAEYNQKDYETSYNDLEKARDRAWNDYLNEELEAASKRILWADYNNKTYKLDECKEMLIRAEKALKNADYNLTELCCEKIADNLQFNIDGAEDDWTGILPNVNRNTIDSSIKNGYQLMNIKALKDNEFLYLSIGVNDVNINKNNPYFQVRIKASERVFEVTLVAGKPDSFAFMSEVLPDKSFSNLGKAGIICSFNNIYECKIPLNTMGDPSELSIVQISSNTQKPQGVWDIIDKELIIK